MAKVTDLDEYRAGKQHGYAVAFALCATCRHGWVATYVAEPRLGDPGTLACPRGCGATGGAVDESTWQRERARPSP